MKRLITAHWTEIEKSTDLDPAVLETITYLHEFDREVQYVVSPWSTAAIEGG